MAGESAAGKGATGEGIGLQRGQVVRLDRGFPLVKLDEGGQVRCEHATDLVKEGAERAVVGDFVLVDWPEGHDKAIIADILPRGNQLVRKDPTERAIPQVLAANFDVVIVAQPLSEVNIRRLERELVLAHETGAQVAVVLTKADLAEDERAVQDVRSSVKARVGADVATLVVSEQDERSIEAVRDLIAPNKTAVLIGRSGVGKSSLVNLLVGRQVQETATVRSSDGKGRHTTVSREIVDVPGGGRVVDMPGVRGLGMWEADAGIGAAFADIEDLAAQCRFRDCRHRDEPGCAVRAAVEDGTVSAERLDSYQTLKRETEEMRERREQAAWKAPEQSARKGRPHARAGGPRKKPPRR